MTKQNSCEETRCEESSWEDSHDQGSNNTFKGGDYESNDSGGHQNGLIVVNASGNDVNLLSNNQGQFNYGANDALV